ncbi:tyrosine-protein phosphatase non-receptor type 18 [Periophthalmus magnuspinnatus]|uniref:tyrosine-protein phosphatase non-receptor type 18 n=1 Tax=Periophthalmus magnuspinnatus TaxID=409849 RepID=UPI00145A64BD|nr:tyrosine-protein phosphatase non-receptor type 18 [Periophthalmus magnuspinnatus]
MSDLKLLASLMLSLDNADQHTIEQEFTMLRTQSVAWKKSQCSESGALKENIKKNRYKDILPYDDSRVILSLKTSESDGDYINASFIQGALSGGYIAAQAPLSSTLRDFWRLIWEYQVKVIVMACREFEMAKKKCEVYWSPLNQTTSFGPFSVHCQGETSPTQDIIVRELQVSFQKDVRVVTQLQFLSWPDHDVPHEASGVLDLLHRIQDLQKSSPHLVQAVPNPPNRNLTLVHCSAGCGRTGVICVLDQIYQLLIHQKLTSDFNIMRIVMEVRRQRPSAVQTKEQYRFIYTATSCLFRWFLKKNNSDSVYCNLPRKNTSITTAVTDDRSQKQNMDATYAVVNKKGAAPQSSTLPRKTDMSPHYDNVIATPTPVYSIVRPRAKPQPSDTRLYDMATPTSSDVTPQYHLDPEASGPMTEADDDYEDLTPSGSDTCSLPPSNGIGFNKRVPKPRGPRDPPTEWTRLER